MKENTPLYEGYLKSLHPHLTGEPEHRLVLEPEDEARLRARAQKAGLDYDQLRRNFEISHQVISSKPHAQGLQLMDKNAVPINALKNYFDGMIAGATGYVKRRQEGTL